MAKLEIIPTFLPNKGIVLNKPEEMLDNNFETDGSRNMEFADEFLQGRLGLMKFDPTVLSGPVLLEDQYWRDDGSWFLMVCTPKDIYAYNFADSRFDILTPLYQEGTIEIQAGSLRTVRGTDTVWTENLKKGDFIKIGTGEVHTGSTWYKVDSVDSDTELTLETDAVETEAGSRYVARQVFTGGDFDFWKSAQFKDKNMGTVWLAVNGVNGPILYEGGTSARFVRNLPTGFTTARYIGVYKDRVLYARTTEGGKHQPGRERWSNVADCESYRDKDFRDFVDDNYWITGIINFSEYHIVCRERDAYIGRPVGGEMIYDFDRSTSFAGLWAPGSLVALTDYLYYYGPDNKFHRWNLLRDETISEQIFPLSKDYNPTYDQNIFGWDVGVKNQIRWFCPMGDSTKNNLVVVFDYSQEVLQLWKYEHPESCCSIGEYINTSDLFIDDPVWGEYYLDEQEGYWDSRQFLDGAPILIYGGYDGIIRKADISLEDDGYPYQRVFESVRQNHKTPHIWKRLWKQEHWLNPELAGTVTLRLKRDDANAWDATTKSISLVEPNKSVIKKAITWDKHAANFKTRLEAYNHFAMLGYINFIFAEGKVVR